MLIPPRRKKILKIFLDNPFKEAHLREIARISKVSLTNVKNSLSLFVRDGLFIRRDISNMAFFKPNLKNESLLKAFELLELEKKEAFYKQNKQIARLLKEYTELAIGLSNKRIQLLILFGSVARGEWTKKSDIDILAVTSEDNDAALKALSKAQTEVSPLLQIAPITTTTKKFLEGFGENTAFYSQLWKDRVILYNEFLFWQLVREGGRA